jgi:hypothetical protein
VYLAAVLGCDRVCLVGQDMAVREDGRSHVSDSFYTDLAANQVDVASCRRLPGNTAESVPVEEKLYVYLKTFEQLVAQRPRLSFLNTSKYGARIAGVPYATLEEARRWIEDHSFCEVTSVVRDRWRKSKGKGLNFGGIGAVLEPTMRFAEAALARALKLVAEIESLPVRFSGEEFRNAPEMEQILREVGELEKTLKSQPQEFRILESGRTRLELFRCGEFEAEAHGGSNHWKQVLMAREYAWAIAEGAWFLNRCLGRFVAHPERG